MRSGLKRIRESLGFIRFKIGLCCICSVICSMVFVAAVSDIYSLYVNNPVKFNMQMPGMLVFPLLVFCGVVYYSGKIASLRIQLKAKIVLGKKLDEF